MQSRQPSRLSQIPEKDSIDRALEYIFTSDDDMNKPVGKLPSKVAQMILGNMSLS